MRGMGDKQKMAQEQNRCCPMRVMTGRERIQRLECFVGIVIVESAAGGVGAIEGIPCSAAGRVGDRFIDLTVGDGGEGSGLVDDAGDAVGEGGGFHPIEDNGTDSDLDL